MKTVKSTTTYVCDVCGQGYAKRNDCAKHEAKCNPHIFLRVPDNIESFKLANHGRFGVWLKEANSKNLNAWTSNKSLPKLSNNESYRIIGRIPERLDGANFLIERYNLPF